MYASPSGKMDSALSTNWTYDVFIPAVEKCRKLSDEDDFNSNPTAWDEESVRGAGASELLDGDNTCAQDAQDSQHCERRAWPRSIYCENQARHYADRLCRGRPDSLILYDSWAGNKQISRAAHAYGVRPFLIPPRLTSDLQPLDAGFNRQYKQFVNRVVHQSRHESSVKQTTTREAIMNIHSLVWNQFASPIYRPMLIWCWHSTDPALHLADDHLLPNMVRVVQFSFSEH